MAPMTTRSLGAGRRPGFAWVAHPVASNGPANAPAAAILRKYLRSMFRPMMYSSSFGFYLPDFAYCTTEQANSSMPRKMHGNKWFSQGVLTVLRINVCGCGGADVRMFIDRTLSDIRNRK